MKNKFLPIIFICVAVLFFFKAFLLEGKLPIPSDTIIGLYHPFRDYYAKDYPRGIPFKNFLITDSVRQQYPWRELTISLEKNLELPLWNPYTFSGTPLLANLQSAPFYPLNILFFILPFYLAWSILIFLEPLLAGIFLYFYLHNLRLNKWASFLGALTFSFCGFFVAWMEWGTILHSALWLPLILLAIDKIFSYSQPFQNSKLQIKNQKLIIWSIIFIFSLTSSFFAGHLQTFFYVGMLSVVYVFTRWWQYGKSVKKLLLFTIYYLLFTIVTAIQWVPTLQFIFLSARDIDQANWQEAGWFIPWQHLIQFVAPDFFGNPATLNYWGVWNYGEFVGYIGILPLIMSIFALFFRHDKKTLFYGTVFFLSLIFSLPTIFAKLPYLFHIPLLSSAQPTRLLFLADFSLAVLVALGFDYSAAHKKTILYPLTFLALVFIGLWFFVFYGQNITNESLSVARHNLLLPTTLFMVSAILLFAAIIFSTKYKITMVIYVAIMAITVFDLLRFGLKFTPFTNNAYLFPKTETLSFLQKQKGQFRIMATDSRILPPNFLIIYRLQGVDGYDPLYLRRFGELIASSERQASNISPPFGFNRIITPHNFNSKIINLLGVKYVLALQELSSPKLKKVFQEGQTRVYENKEVLPRIFFVSQVESVKNKETAIQRMWQDNFDLQQKAVVEDLDVHLENAKLNIGRAKVVFYSENRVIVETENDGDGFLVLTDSFYPTWHAKIDPSISLGEETKIFLTDYNFRGIVVPKGKHIVEFYDRL